MIVRYKEDPTSSVLMVMSIILLAGTLAFVLLVKPPQGPSKAARINAENELRLETAIAQKELEQSKAFNTSNTWAGSQDDVAPAVLARVTQFANNRGLRLVSLRPQRVDNKSVPPLIPFLAVVEGPYTSAIQFARDLENPGNRLAVTLVQVTSADAATDKVTASIGIAAYMQPRTTAPTSTGAKKETDRA